ncbi:MAG: hypothetical protein AAF702_37760 [Chloroflexota bacterium]
MFFPRYYFLKDDEQLLVQAFTRRFMINGPKMAFIPPLWKVTRLKATTLGPIDYLLIRNTLTGELRNVIGPTLFFREAEDEVVEERQSITLRQNEYVCLIDNLTGTVRVERGEQTIYLSPTEDVINAVQVGVNIDEETAVLVRDNRTGQLSLITNKQVFVPEPHQEVAEVRKRIRLEDNEAVIIKDENGRYLFHRGSDETKRAFFLEPHQELVALRWSSGIYKDQRNLMITHFDLRPKFMWYEFEARTQDNVELVIGVTFFWEISDLEKMIGTTDDTPGDICSHARSAIIQAVSRVTLEQFLASFNEIIRSVIIEGDLTFYLARGVALHAVEVRSVSSKDPSTQKVLQEIINETTNRINRLQKQESENEVSLKGLQGEIEKEQQRGQLLDLRRQHAQIEGAIAGETEAQRVQAFLNGLGEDLPIAEKVAIFNTLRKQEALERLSEGNAQLYFTPADVDLTIRSG